MKKRRRRSDAKWQQLLEQQQCSGLCFRAFCQQQGLTSKTFYNRRQALWQQPTAMDSTERFIKVQPSSTALVGGSNDSGIELPLWCKHRPLCLF